MIEMLPVKFEAYDTETNDGLFMVESFDECSATVRIDTVVSVESWDEIAAKIREALCLMHAKIQN